MSYLTEELVRQGHEVTLFASGDSQSNARLVPACPRALWRDPTCRETLPHHVRQMELVFEDVSRFDVIHFHGDYLHFPFLRRQPCPNVTTLHGRLHVPDMGPLFEEYREMPLVSISDNQRRPMPSANWQATVYHGLPTRFAHVSTESRQLPGLSGPHFSREATGSRHRDRLASGMKLKVAAKIYPEERGYFHETIEPMLRKYSQSRVEFIGEVGGREKDEFLGKRSRACCSPSTGRSHSAWS